MCEKRFRFEKECTENFFTEKGVFYNNEKPIGANEIIALLNSLSDENEMLKKRLRKCANNWKQEIVKRGKLEEEIMTIRDYYESQISTRDD